VDRYGMGRCNGYGGMTEAQGLVLGFRILQFLRSCGGPYERGICSNTEWAVFYCLGAGQFIIKEEGDEIRWFACYWKIRPEDVEDLAERIRPLDLSGGSVMYVHECGNKEGKRGMAEIVKTIRERGVGMEGVFWHRPAKHTKTMLFPSQKGGAQE
jgi:hypothetical protein